MSSDACLAIHAEGVSKCYAIYEKPADRLKQMLASGIGRLTKADVRRFYTPFWALHDVSLDVRRGECVALIGRNGSGKSTLLQIITGTVTPTSGIVQVDGRVAALLELGSGFNPEFTGLENVYLNAALLGMSRGQVDERLDAILSFADIGDFVRQPVKTYSSGMVVRLAFAVQAQIDPDVLIVDEALAVGDARFQAKCFARLKALRENGTSIWLVTHSTEQVVTHCDRAVLLDGGVKLDDGKPRPIVNRYLDLLYGRGARKSGDAPSAGETMSVDEASMPAVVDTLDPEFASRTGSQFAHRPLYNPYEYRWGDGRAEIADFMVCVAGAGYPQTVRAGAALQIFVRYRFSEPMVHPVFGITLKTKEGLTVYGTNTELTAPDGCAFGSGSPDGVVFFEFGLNCAAGDYFISLGIASRDVSGEVIPHDRRYDSIHVCVSADDEFIGITDLGARIKVLQ